MGGPAKKKPIRTQPPEASSSNSPTSSSQTRKLATIVISIILIISLGLPAAGLGFVSCSSCSIPIYD